MRKIFFSLSIFLFVVGILFFNSCAKEKGKTPPKPFNFHAVEGFESSSYIPTGWTWYNPDNDATWQIVTTVPCTGTNCMGFNNCSGDGPTTDMTGRKDRCITTSYDLTNATSASISFDVAYADLNFHSKLYTDSLAVFASADGGATWTQIYLKGGDALASVPTITTSTPCWAPASLSDWRTDNIIVNNLAGKSNVKFAFENRSDWGEWIYLDNVSITATNVVTDCAGVTYAKTIQPIVQSNCATTGCHVPGGLGPTDFTTYAGIKSDVDIGTFKKRMIDGNPSFMPASGKLPDAILSKVQCWLDSGAPNN